MLKTYKDLRNEMSMTQDEVAKYLGISKSTISLIENYKRGLSLSNCVKYVALYNERTGKNIDFINDVKHKI